MKAVLAITSRTADGATMEFDEELRARLIATAFKLAKQHGIAMELPIGSLPIRRKGMLFYGVPDCRNGVLIIIIKKHLKKPIIFGNSAIQKLFCDEYDGYRILIARYRNLGAELVMEGKDASGRPFAKMFFVYSTISGTHSCGNAGRQHYPFWENKRRVEDFRLLIPNL